jgi:hypothetical protein
VLVRGHIQQHRLDTLLQLFADNNRHIARLDLEVERRDCQDVYYSNNTNLLAE